MTGKQSVVAGWLLLVSLLCCHSSQAAAASHGDLLNQAEQISSIDGNKLNHILARLEPHTSAFSSLQQQHYRLLKVEQALYAGQTALASQVLSEFNSTQQPMTLRYRAKLLSARTAMAAQQYQTAFNHLQSALQDYALIRNPQLQAAALLLAVEFYLRADMSAEAQHYQQLLASLADTQLEQCQAVYLQVRAFDRQQLAQASLVDQDILQHCRNTQLDLQTATLQWFNARVLLAGNNTTAPQLPFDASEQALRIDSQLWQIAAALSSQRLPDANQLSSKLLTLPEAAMTIQQRLDLLRLRLAVVSQQQQLAEVVLVQQKIYDVAQTLQKQQATLKLVAQQAIYLARQKNDQLLMLQQELKAAGLESQLKQQLVQRNHTVIALLLLLLLGLAYGLFKLAQAHQYYKTAALTDRCTGIGNRRWLDSQLMKLLHRCKQQARPAGMILFDIDQYNQLMAERGHVVAERALQAVSRICHHFIRHGDLFCYLENGCFAIVLPDCQPDKVLMLAEICRDAIAEPAPSPQPDALQLTASFGVSFTLNSGYSEKELWRHADQALYLAKHHGQNRVECFDNQPGIGRPLIHRTLTADLAG